MIYDRPVSELMGDAVKAQTSPFTGGHIVTWFDANYPKVKRTTIAAHIYGLTSNVASRQAYPWLASKTPLFFRNEQGLLEPFDPDQHIGVGQGGGTGTDDGDLGEALVTEQTAEFALESQLETFLSANWGVVNWGRPLRIWQGTDGRSGHQLSTPIGRLDFLCVDTATGALVVVELKRGRPSDAVVGQIARYMGWVKLNLATERQNVEGLIIAFETDDALGYAVSALPGLRLMTYEVKFELRPVEPPKAAAAE